MKLSKAYLVLVGMLAAMAVAVPVAGAGPTPAELRALEIRGQALDNLCASVGLAGSDYQVLCGTEGARSRMTAAALLSLEIRGQGMNRLCDTKRQRVLSSEAIAALCSSAGAATGQFTQVIRPGGFQWDDFGIGAGAMLGLTLVAGGLVAASHFSRRTGMRSRPAP